MMKRVLYALVLSASLGACSTTSDSGPYGTYGGSTGVYDGSAGVDSSRVRAGYGTVESVQTVDRHNPGVIGAIGGAVVGGLLGNQIGSGRGNTAATIAGAAGGAIAGREIEKRVRKDDDLFKIFVRMDDGTYQAIAQETQPYVRPGDRVRVENGVVTPI
jgi:outer membrane lipoprotein SlyB